MLRTQRIHTFLQKRAQFVAEDTFKRHHLPVVKADKQLLFRLGAEYRQDACPELQRLSSFPVAAEHMNEAIFCADQHLWPAVAVHICCMQTSYPPTGPILPAQASI